MDAVMKRSLCRRLRLRISTSCGAPDWPVAACGRGQEVTSFTRIEKLLAGVPPALALRAALELEIFTRIGDGVVSADRLGTMLSVPPDRLSRLLYALASIGLLEVENGRFRNGAEAATFLDAAKPTYRGGDHELLRELWSADLLTADSLRENRPAALHDFSKAGSEAAAAFSRKIAPGALIFGRNLARAMDLSAVGSVIDIGGGPGTVLVGIRERWPHVAATLMELPPVAAAARTILSEYGADDVVVEEGDIIASPSSGRHDLAILKAVVQVLPSDQARRSILNAAQCLTPGGEIVIAGWGVINDDRLGPPDGVFLNLTFLNLYQHGEAYTESEYCAWMKEAGFDDIARSRVSDGCTIFRARLTV